MFTTPAAALDYAKQQGIRVRIHYGVHGKDWGDNHDVTGYVGMSTGREPVRLLLNNIRSQGGSATLGDEHIVRVRYANRKEGGDLYLHPEYKAPARGNFADDSLWVRNFS